MSRPTVTAVLNAHREAMLAKPSIECLKRAVAYARTAGVTVEVLLILDRSDLMTSEVINYHKASDFQVIKTEFGDLGLARNEAINAANGQYVAFLDADDLWGENWLARAVDCARARSDEIIWHPEINVYFGTDRYIFRHIDMEEHNFSASGLALENYWTALSFAAREVYIAHPYPSTDLKSGFGFEDWAWNMRTINAGILHKVVPGTGHVIRRRGGSLSRATIAARSVPRPTAYLRNYVLHRNNPPSTSSR